MDWMPLGDDDILIHLTCGKREDGHWHGFFSIKIRAEALLTHGLHPDQPWSTITQTQPAWWRAEARRLLLGGGQHRRSHRH
ncbi:hypothetical protein [Catenulispora subtropica]|uniref:Uncharacterized protein n=1 Tax=Catenulispora subtropica TaxID=450798 RepID=A0ABN2T8S2_9ACTN